LINILEKFRKPTLVVAILGAIKLVLDVAGIPVLTDENINAIANGVAAVATIVGILINRDAVQ